VVGEIWGTLRDTLTLRSRKPVQARKSTKGWRPISLISVPAKGLERLVARRLANAALGKGVFGPL